MTLNSNATLPSDEGNMPQNNALNAAPNSASNSPAFNPSAKSGVLARPRDRDALIQSLRTGVVPRIGQHLVQVGRKLEIQALISDIERINDAGSSFRLVTGEYGAGKTFFLNLVRSMCLEQKLVVANADLNPDRRLHATGGQARSLYSELMRNLSTRTKPDGNALQVIIEKFISLCDVEAKNAGVATQSIISKNLTQLTELLNGFDFAQVIQCYYKAFEDGNDQMKMDAIRWLRAEYSTRTEARQALGVRNIITDDTVYDHLKLMGLFIRLAGFGGLMVVLDEMVNLYKLQSKQARDSNYEQLLRYLNDSLQGNSRGLGFILGGTPEFLTDPRRGLFSYQALQSRLALNTYAKDGLIDYHGPVIPLAMLTQDDFYVLLKRLRDVYVNGDESRYRVSDQGIEQFMSHCAGRIGERYFKTPRNTIRQFIDVLSVMEQNAGASWESLIGKLDIVEDKGADNDKVVGDDDDMVTFKL